MNEVFTLVPQASAEARDKMIADVKAFSSEMGILPEKAVPALYQAISAGVPQDNVFISGDCTESRDRRRH